MRLSSGDVELDVDTSTTVTFGRGDDVDIRVAAADDVSVSRRAGRLEFDRFAWRLTNVGRRSFSVVEAGEEIELRPDAHDRSAHQILHDETWIRIGVAHGDAALVLSIPDSERPAPSALHGLDAGGGTLVEQDVHLTDNERRSVVAVYEGYLALPPHYRREPNSYRAAARRLGAEEGKVKADLRRVQEKVGKAGGPAEGGSRARDALIAWLASRRVVTRDDLALLESVLSLSVTARACGVDRRRGRWTTNSAVRTAGTPW